MGSILRAFLSIERAMPLPWSSFTLRERSSYLVYTPYRCAPTGERQAIFFASSSGSHRVFPNNPTAAWITKSAHTSWGMKIAILTYLLVRLAVIFGAGITGIAPFAVSPYHDEI
jgi:hypothetical protein